MTRGVSKATLVFFILIENVIEKILTISHSSSIINLYSREKKKEVYIYMIFGLFFILVAWLVPELPLWLSIIMTVFGSGRLLLRLLTFGDALIENNNR